MCKMTELNLVKRKQVYFYCKIRFLLSILIQNLMCKSMKNLKIPPAQHSLWHDWLTVFSGNGIRLLIGMGASVLIVRSLGVENYGAYALLTAIISIAASLSDFGLTPTAVKSISTWLPDKPSRAGRIARTYLATKAGFAAVFSGGGIVLAPMLSVYILGDDRFVWLVRLSFLGVFTTTLSNIAGAFLHAARRFRIYTVLQLMNPLLLLLVVALGWFSGGIQLSRLMALIVFLPVVHAVLAFPASRRLVSAAGRPQKSGRCFKIVRQLLKFSIWIFFASGLAAMFSQIDIFLVRRWSGADAAGYYALALSLAMKAAMLNGSLGTTLLPRVSEVKSAVQLRVYLRSALRKTLTATLLIGFSLFLVKPLILLLYGKAFLPAAPLTILLLLMVAVNLNVLPFSMLLYPLNRPQWLAGVEFAKLLIFIMIAGLNVERMGVAGVALAKLIAEMLAGLWYFYLIRKLRGSFSKK